ncbi:uncharacterized protein [Chironomus tepperi]|uniref:uncharacterized protein n=1 Tax=Chironomus tepperi TaxID=113505 RepID=UPI00391F22CC
MMNNNRDVIEFIREPNPKIQRKQYKFMVQTKYLSERQIFSEAFLRGLVSGEREEVVTREQKQIIDSQLRCDYEHWIRGGNNLCDFTPIVMNHRATVDEISILMTDMIEEVDRMQVSRASPYAIGVQLEFGANCMKRTVVTNPDEWDLVQEIVDTINTKYAEVCNQIENSRQQNTPLNNTFPVGFQTPGPNFHSNQPNVFPQYFVPQYFPPASTPFLNQQTPMFPMQQQYAPRTFQNVYNGQVPVNNNNIPENVQQDVSYNINNANLRQQVNLGSNIPQHGPQLDRNRNWSPQVSLLNGRNESSLVGPHKVSATIISIIGKNVYEPHMDALDKIEMWEGQAKNLQQPIDYFLSYMEILLSSEMQNWWQLHRSRIHTWEQFRKQFLEDFGDHNRVIKAEQAIASLTQGPDETFQQLYLRFTKLMSRVKPVKSEADQLYILRSSLKPELRTACMSVTTMTDLKKLCQEFEGMQSMYTAKESKQSNPKPNKICTIDNASHMDVDSVDFWNNEIIWNDMMDEEDRTLVINENLDKRKTAMNQSWTKEQKKEWLSKQTCWNCDCKGHLQGQCNKSWTPHCVKCGNKNASNSKECPKCSGNMRPSVSGGAGQ